MTEQEFLKENGSEYEAEYQLVADHYDVADFGTVQQKLSRWLGEIESFCKEEGIDEQPEWKFDDKGFVFDQEGPVLRKVVA